MAHTLKPKPRTKGLLQPSRVQPLTKVQRRAGELELVKGSSAKSASRGGKSKEPVEAAGIRLDNNEVVKVAPDPALLPAPKTEGSALSSERAKEIRKLRTTYGKQLPKLNCNNCTYTQQCPYCKEGYECAFLSVIGGVKVDSLDDMEEALKRVIEANLTTAELGLIQQRLAGGVIDANTSNRLDAAFQQLMELRRLHQQKVMGGSPFGGQQAGGSIILNLFGNLGKQVEPVPEMKTITMAPPPPPDKEKVAAVLHSEKERELDETLEEFRRDEG